MTDISPHTPIFDGHNDLLLHLWLHHPDNPAEAFMQQRLSGHLDFARMQAGGFAGGLFAIFVPPADYVAKFPARQPEVFDPLAIVEQQLHILQQLAAGSAGRGLTLRPPA